MASAWDVLTDVPQAELLWASPWEILNVVQADAYRMPHRDGDPRSPEEVGGLGRDLDGVSL